MSTELTKEKQIETLLDANEAAKVLGIHPVTLREFAREKRIPGVQIGRSWRFRPSSLNRWLDQQEERP